MAFAELYCRMCATNNVKREMENEIIIYEHDQAVVGQYHGKMLSSFACCLCRHASTFRTRLAIFLLIANPERKEIKSSKNRLVKLEGSLSFHTYLAFLSLHLLLLLCTVQCLQQSRER